jgi:mono/diheme cytochrome c family protein
MHSLVLLVHSWLRWALLAATVVFVVRAGLGWRRRASWDVSTERLHAAVVGLFNLQFLLGLALYLLLSPLPRAFLADPGPAMKDATLRFFAIEHAFGMVLAIGLVHAGRARSRRATDAAQRHRRAFGFTLAGLLVMLVTIPWPLPFLKHARPLARSPAELLPARGATPTAAVAACSPVYRERCAACHGDGGRGDGPSARSLRPPPRDFANPRWQEERSDEQLRAVIVDGGAAIGLGPGMPASPDLSREDVDGLVACIRGIHAR